MPHTVAELQADYVTLEIESIAWMYLNCDVPQLTSAGGVAAYFRNHKGHRFASTKQAVDTSEAFRRNVFCGFAERNAIPVHRFAKGERKDDAMHGPLRDFPREEGMWGRGAALRTETTINNSYDFGVGRLNSSTREFAIDRSSSSLAFWAFGELSRAVSQSCA